MMNASAASQADEEEQMLDTPELFVVLFTLTVLGVLFVIGIGTNSILLLAFQRRPNLRTVSNRYRSIRYRKTWPEEPITYTIFII